MDPTLLLPADTRSTAGILLLTIVAVQYGGVFMLRVVRGQHPVTPFQATFARAGHAHAGVLVTLALVCQILADATAMSGLWALLARNGMPLAAILCLPGSSYPLWGAASPSLTGWSCCSTPVLRRWRWELYR